MPYPDPPTWTTTILVAVLAGILIGALGSLYILLVLG